MRARQTEHCFFDKHGRARQAGEECVRVDERTMVRWGRRSQHLGKHLLCFENWSCVFLKGDSWRSFDCLPVIPTLMYDRLCHCFRVRDKFRYAIQFVKIFLVHYLRSFSKHRHISEIRFHNEQNMTEIPNTSHNAKAAVIFLREVTFSSSI